MTDTDTRAMNVCLDMEMNYKVPIIDAVIHFLEPRRRDSLCFSPLWMKRQRPRESSLKYHSQAWQNHGWRRHDVDSCCNMPTISWQNEITRLILYLLNTYYTIPFLCWVLENMVNKSVGVPEVMVITVQCLVRC